MKCLETLSIICMSLRAGTRIFSAESLYSHRLSSRAYLDVGHKRPLRGTQHVRRLQVHVHDVCTLWRLLPLLLIRATAILQTMAHDGDQVIGQSRKVYRRNCWDVPTWVHKRIEAAYLLPPVLKHLLVLFRVAPACAI